jgi:hypothetical protein
VDPAGELYLPAVFEQARQMAGLPPLLDVEVPMSEAEEGPACEEEAAGEGGQPEEEQPEEEQPEEEQPEEDQPEGEGEQPEGQDGQPPPKRRRRRLAPQERAWLYRAFDIQDPTGMLISASDLRAILTAGQTSDPPTLGAGVTENYVRSAQRSWRGLRSGARLERGAVAG